MILGFLGKGGSGKSTAATQSVLFLRSKNFDVLAIDADHNMDLSHNLCAGELPQMNYLSQSLSTFTKAIGLLDNQKYSEAFLNSVEDRFKLSPLSPELADFSTLIQNDIRLMTAGPQTDTVLYGKSCSHTLTTPLKVLLPLLELNENEIVVVDEKAGADGVTTGIVTGFDVGVIVVEPAIHSLKTAKQIAELMDFYGTPYIFVGNKISDQEDQKFLEEGLSNKLDIILPFVSSLRREPNLLVDEWQESLEKILNRAKELSRNDRLQRTKEKFERNAEFLVSHH